MTVLWISDILLFSHLDTYFWLGVGLLRLIGRYICICSRRETTVKYRKTTAHSHMKMTKEFCVLVLSQQILKTLMKFCVSFFNINIQQALQIIDCFSSFVYLDLSGLKPETVLKSEVTRLITLINIFF